MKCPGKPSVLPVKLIGVGNMFRRDDGLGIHAVQCLANMQIPGLSVEELCGEGASLLEAFKGVAHLILVDAVSSTRFVPGTIVRLDAHSCEVPTDLFYCSSHQFSVAEAVELARILGVLPKKMVLYGIVGADYSEGFGLSEVVENASSEMISHILGELMVFRSLAGKKRNTTGELCIDS